MIMNTTTSEASRTVCSHFGIRYSPFTDTFPIAEPFATKGETLLLERMRMLLGQGKSVSVTGEPGSGKSMFLKTLLSALEPKSFRFAYVPFSGLKPNTLLREICDKLAIDTTGRGSLLGRLAKAFSRKEEAPYTVIVLDEAHALPGEALLELFSLTHDPAQRTASASLVLCGHPVLEKTLALDIHSAIRTRIAARFGVRPLQEEEVGEFIAFRLKAAKAPSDLFTKDALKLIELDSKGNRRVIMNLAGNCMDLAVIRQEKLITGELAREVCEQA
jgi:type II secretory pathway predicted ATPase ExeA